MPSRTFNIFLTVFALSTSVGAMVVLIYATADWCVYVTPVPWRLLVVGVGLGALAGAFSAWVADRSILMRVLKPLLLAFVAEYAFAFGTLGLGYVSTSLMESALLLHRPAILLASVVVPGDSGRETIGRDIAIVTEVEWLLILLGILLVGWFVRRRHRKMETEANKSRAAAATAVMSPASASVEVSADRGQPPREP